MPVTFRDNVAFNDRPNFSYVEPEGETEKIRINGADVSAPRGVGKQFADIQVDDVFDSPSGVIEEATATFEKQAAFVTLLANSYDIVSDVDAAQFIADRSKALASAQRRRPKYMREFTEAWDKANGFFEGAGVILSNSRAIGRTALTQTANSSIPLLTTVGGAVSGSAVGPVGAVAGGVGGSFVGSAIVEIGSEIDGLMAKEGIDTSDAGQVLKALQNEAFIKHIRGKAEAKGLTTATVDALFQVVGGKFTRMAATGGGKVGGAILDVAVQSVGEGVGEGVGQKVAYDKVNYKDAVLEAITSVGQSVGQTAVGATVTGTKKVIKPKQEIAGVEVPKGTTQEVKNIIENEVAENIPDVTKARARLERLEAIPLEDLSEDGQQVIKRGIDQQKATIQAFESKIKSELELLSAKEGKGTISVPKKVETLAGFLIKQGRLDTKSKTFAGEAKRFTRKESPDLKGVASNKGKLDLDTALLLAKDSGFLREDAEINDLLDALDSESFGTAIVRDEDLGQQIEREEALEFNEQQRELNQELIETSKKIKTLRQAFKRGVSAAKQDVKAVQSTIISLLNKSQLSINDKAKFIATIKNTQTVEQLEKALPKIQERVEGLTQKDVFKSLRAKLDTALSRKNIKHKVQSGKRVGRFDAATQERLEELSELNSLSQEDAQKELYVRFGEENTDVLANRILSLRADGSLATPDEVAEILADITAIRTLGKAKADMRKAVLEMRAQNLRDKIVAFNEEKDPEAFTKKSTGFHAAFTRTKQSMRTGISLLSGSWGELIDRVAPATLVDELGVRREISEQKRIMRKKTDALLSAAKEAYSLNDPAAVLKEVEESNRIVDLGVYEDMNGKKVRLERSRSQVRKIWMEAQNAKLLTGTLQNEKGNAYTDEMMQVMFALMTDADYKFAQSQLKIYEAFYNDINNVYKKVYGINLGKQEFYSPIRREVEGEMPDTDFISTLSDPSAVKMRDPHANAPLQVRSDIEVFNSHLAEMSRFIAFKEKMQLLDRVFKDTETVKSIKAVHGKFILSELKETLEYMNGTGKAYTTIIDKQIDYLNRNFAVAKLGLKAKIGLTQLSSLPAYWEFIPFNALSSGAIDFFKNYKKAIKILGNTELMLDRGASIDADITKMGKTFDLGFVKKIQDKKANFVDMALIFTKFGDRAAIYVGGWAVYKHAIDNGKTHEQAVAAFEDATAATQQSKDIDQVSYLQRSNSITRGLSMFMTAPIAQFRGEIRAIRRYGKGEISKQQLAKGLVIYHVLIPQLYQALANGILAGEFDEEDQLRALMFGSLSGIPIVGDILTAAVRKAQGKYNMPQDNFKWAATMKDAMVSAMDAMISGKDGDLDLMLEALYDLSKSSSELVGFPEEGFTSIFDGINDIVEGNVKKGVLEIAGFPKSVTDKSSKAKGGFSF